jgi:2-dehydropantoate 2-reductase
MRLAIYGAGSIGTVLGAYITKSGTEIDLVNRNVAHIEALRSRGATIQGAADFTTPVRALLPSKMTGTYDIIFLLTKQQSNAEVIQFLLPFLGTDGVVCTLQNGVPEPELAAAAGPARVLGGTVEWGAEMISPGICFLTSTAGNASFRLG